MTSAGEPRYGAFERIGRESDVTPGLDDAWPSPDDGPQRTSIGNECRHDLDAIMALQADDMVFQLHAEGFERAVGAETIRAQFAYFLEAWSDLRFVSLRQL